MLTFKKRAVGLMLFISISFSALASLPQQDQAVKTREDILKRVTGSNPDLQPAPRARVSITILGKQRSVETDEYGVFGLEITDPDKLFGSENTLEARLLVTTFPPLPKSFSDFPLTLQLDRSEGPLYALAVVYDRNSNALLALKLRADLILTSPPAGIMLQKNDPFRASGQYRCQVAVF